MGNLMRTDFLNEEFVTPVVLLHTMDLLVAISQ